MYFKGNNLNSNLSRIVVSQGGWDHLQLQQVASQCNETEQFFYLENNRKRLHNMDSGYSGAWTSATKMNAHSSLCLVESEFGQQSFEESDQELVHSRSTPTKNDSPCRLLHGSQINIRMCKVDRQTEKDNDNNLILDSIRFSQFSKFICLSA